MTEPTENAYFSIVTNRTANTAERLAALLALIDDYQHEYFDALLARLTDGEEETEIRGAVAMCFGKLLNNAIHQSVLDERTERLIGQMEVLAKDEPNEVVRGYIITALGMSGRTEVIHAIVAALKDPDLKVFHNAAEALGRFGRAGVPHLINQLSEGADDAKCIAAWKLGELGYGEAVPPLLKLLNSHPSNEVAALAIWALGEIGIATPEVTAVLDNAQRHPEPEIHQRAHLAAKKIARNWN